MIQTFSIFAVLLLLTGCIGVRNEVDIWVAATDLINDDLNKTCGRPNCKQVKTKYKFFNKKD